MNSVNARPAKRFRVNAIGTFLVTLLSAGIAWSQATPAPANPTLGDFMPKDGDMSLMILRTIFGDWEGNAVVPMLGAAMRQLNIFALAFGTLMFTWVSIIGTLNSAQDGEVLGKRWSTTWVPLRFVVGTALMVPLSTGYSTAQHLILWLAMAGSGGASAVWGHAMAGFAGTQAVNQISNPDAKLKAEALFTDVLRAEVCLAVMSEATSEDYRITKVPNGGAAGSRGPYSVDLHYGIPGGSRAKDCGVVSGLEDTGLDTADPSGWFEAVVDGVSSLGQGQDTTPAARQYVQAQIDMIMAASEDTSQLGLRNVARLLAARSVGAENPSQPQGQPTPLLNDQQAKDLTKAAIKAAAARYLQSMAAPAARLANEAQLEQKEYLESSRKAGWMMAGPSFFGMAAIRSKVAAMIKDVPEFSDVAMNESAFDVTRQAAVSDLRAIEARIQGYVGDGVSNEELPFSLTMWIAETIAVDPSNSDHALVQIKSSGDHMMWIGQTIGFAGGVLDIASGVLGSGSGEKADGSNLAKTSLGLKILGPLLAMGKTALYIVAGALFFAGLTMSLILPTLPFLMSLGAITGWLMAVFSAVVAAPIWLAGHLNPEGEGIAGQRAAGGYMILLETATRPIFIVFGLIGAFLIMDPVCRFAAYAFKATMYSVQDASTTGIASMVGLLCLYVIAIWTVVRTTLTLVYDLAQKVYTWVGGQFAGYEKAAEFAQGAQSANQSAARGLTEAKAMVAGTRDAIVKQYKEPPSPPRPREN